MGGIIKLPPPKTEEKCVIVIELAGPAEGQQTDFATKFDKFKQDLKRAVDGVKADIPVAGVVRKKY